MSGSSSMMRMSVAMSAASSRPGLVDEVADRRRRRPIEDGADLLLGEALEAGEQEGLPRQRRDLADAHLGRQVALDLLAAAVHRQGVPDPGEHPEQLDLDVRPPARCVSGSLTRVSRVAAT